MAAIKQIERYRMARIRKRRVLTMRRIRSLSLSTIESLTLFPDSRTVAVGAFEFLIGGVGIRFMDRWKNFPEIRDGRDQRQ